MFDRANRYGTGLATPRVLYHYTSWEAAESILTSQQFHATAHDCTNDPAEFASADDTIVELIRFAHDNARGIVTRRILKLFLDTYDLSRINASRRAYFVCFSISRDDPNQWCRYAQGGSGVCLGLRLFGIKNPEMPGIATSIMPVNYGTESDMKEKIEQWLQQFSAALDHAEDVEHNWRLAMDTLNVTTAVWALATKQTKWKPEQEVRMIYLAREGTRIAPLETTRPDGSIKRYLPVRVTARRRMPLREILIGPSQDAEAGREQVRRIFAATGYLNADSKTVVSAATLTPSSVV